MRIRISHTISYAYAEPARQIAQVLRLSPRDHDGQHVMKWRIEPAIDGSLSAGSDPFGNLTHSFFADGPLSQLGIEVEGLVETTDLAGVVRGSEERVPPEVFRRDTLLSAGSEEIAAFAAEATARDATPLARMHGLMQALGDTFSCDPQAAPADAKSAFAARRALAQDIAHVFTAAARSLGQPARYVSGYVAQTGSLPHEGAHGWAEAWIEDYGWIGFDCANGLCPIDTHVRVACGLDFADAAPVRGARKGGTGESLAMRVSARDAAHGFNQ